ncbi:MAG: PAS domain-containing protein [Alphaproteobacteria bacterium]|nr:PAS domain-containing protein [Alphaproteobacteria bacterium]
MGSLNPPVPDVGLSLALSLISSSVAPALLLDGDSVIVAASQSFREAFEVGPEAIPGCRLADLGSGEWKSPQLSTLLKTTAFGDGPTQAYEMDFRRAGFETRRLILNARRLHYGDGQGVRLLLSIDDVTAARAGDRQKDALIRDKAVLVQEVQHRVANSLQIIASVLLQGARQVQSDESRVHLRDAHQRILSVAAVQQQLATSTLGDVGLRAYITDLCRSIGDSMIRDHDLISLEVTADDSIAPANKSVSLGLIVTELVINTLKHAFPEQRPGRIEVDYRAHGGGWTLTVRDDGIGMPKPPARLKPGLGTGIVEALAGQLGAVIKITDARPGTRVAVVCIPVS